ncbi:MAG: IPT/TIG domain-containing protein, partial [Bacteroidota bacterium]
MRRIKLGTLFLISFLCLNFPQTISAQCMNYPVTLEDREMHADHIVLGRIVSQEAYWDREHQNIRTLNIVEVTAWLKGNTGQTEIGVITLGGVVGDRAQVSHPALQLKPWNEYVLFLQGDNFQVDHPSVRQNQPTLIQAEPYADAQGAFTKQSGAYHDLLSEPKHTEASLFNRIQALTGETAATPENRPFTPRHGDTFPLSAWAQHVAENSRGSAPITSFSPNPSHAGTTFASDVITINGSGFGATPGTVFYSNADDGGATFTSSGVATDNLSWNDSQIQNRPAGSAGTGPINVNGTMTSGSNLTINYALIDINSSFAAFANVTRQMPRLVDKNGSGGMTFTLNTAFAANSAANQAFNRALETWVCNTNVNFTVAGATTATSSVGSDGLNVVFFDGTLPAGVLGRANSLFQASATGAC